MDPFGIDGRTNCAQYSLNAEIGRYLRPNERYHGDPDKSCRAQTAGLTRLIPARRHRNYPLDTNSLATRDYYRIFSARRELARAKQNLGREAEM